MKRHRRSPRRAGASIQLGAPGTEFRYRARNAASSLVPLLMAEDAPAGGDAAVLLAGDHGAGRAVLWLCDSRDDGGADPS